MLYYFSLTYYLTEFLNHAFHVASVFNSFIGCVIIDLSLVPGSFRYAFGSALRLVGHAYKVLYFLNTLAFESYLLGMTVFVR
jgi:hypothetical protein